MNGPAPASAAATGPVTVGAAPIGADPVRVTAGDPAGGGTGNLFGALAVYTLLRLALVVVLAGVLSFFMPLIVAAMFAIVIQLPLAWLLFKRSRARVNEAIAAASATRRAERSRLQAGLSGDAV